MQTDVPAQGTVLWIRQQRWRVERARREKNVVRLDVAGRDGRLTFLLPFDRSHEISGTDRLQHVRPRTLAARLAGLLGREEIHSRAIPAAVDAHIHILPYQLEPALALLGSARRVLLADAVGLGKTIQAGLVIAELRRRNPAVRVLVAVPSALKRQWSEELRQHFDLETLHADAHALDELALSGPRNWTPWDRAGVWIGSIDYLKQPHVLCGAARRAWDLVVIDEAHGVCGQTERHAAAADLARCSRRLLLLSATPHSGSEPHFDRLLALGRLSGCDDELIVFRRTRADLGMVADRRTRWHTVGLSIEETRVLDTLSGFERAVLARGARAAGLLLLSVFRKRALSTMGALATSIERRLAFLEARKNPTGDSWLQGRLSFDDADDDVSGDERLGLIADIGLDSAVERSWLRRLQRLAREASRRESKVCRIVAFARRSREPLAIFTEFRDSLNILLPQIEAIRPAAVLHGGQAPEEQQRQLDRFLTGPAMVLLATDVASQGLNLQSRARCVLNLELPWNPSRIEQRAGRVDRIGQRRRVHVGLFVARHDAEAGLLARLVRRSLAARQSFGDEPLHGTGPDEHAVRAHLLTAAPLIEPVTSGHAVSVCTDWSRPARAVAPRLRWQRAFASFWQGPLTGRPHAAPMHQLPHFRRLGGMGILLVFGAPLCDGTGQLIERRFVCVRCAATSSELHRVIDAARALAAQSVAPRVRRLRRLRRTACAMAADRERAISQAMLDMRALAQVQPGLFDRRAIEARSAAAANVAEILHALERRLDDLDSEAAVGAGTPVLAAVLSLSGPAKAGPSMCEPR